MSLSMLLSGCCEWLSPLTGRSSHCCISEKEERRGGAPLVHPPAAWQAAECLWLLVQLWRGSRAQPAVAGQRQSFHSQKCVCTSLGLWAAPAPVAGGVGWGARPPHCGGRGQRHVGRVKGAH